MFSALRQGSVIYILRKGEKPELRIGQVTSVTDPAPKFGNMPVYGQPQPTTVNITVKVEDSAMTFEKLDSGAAIMTYPNENTIVATSREAMNAEVENMFRTSQQILDSVPYHQKVLASCDEIMRTLNPQFAKEKAQEEKIGKLELKVSGMEDTLADIRNMLSSALNAGNVSASKKVTKE